MMDKNAQDISLRDGSRQIRIILISQKREKENKIAGYLSNHGFIVQSLCDDIDFGRDLIRFDPQLVLIERGISTLSGPNLLLKVRGLTDAPCIVLTDNPDPMDRIVNLELGADDDIDRAVPPRELLARIRAILRRCEKERRSAISILNEHAPIIRRSWRFSVTRRELWRPDGTLCPLTSAEFATLRALYDAAGEPLTRYVLTEQVFGRPHTEGDRAIDSLIRKIRMKIDPENPELVVKTVRAVGYVFVGFPEEEVVEVNFEQGGMTDRAA